jgi:hypothetical protein
MKEVGYTNFTLIQNQKNIEKLYYESIVSI